MTDNCCNFYFLSLVEIKTVEARNFKSETLESSVCIYMMNLHKTRQKLAFFGRITNQKLRRIYSKLTCEPKTKDCAGSRSVQHLIATVLFLLLKFPGFHNQSLD